jgi:hypothetical protein
VLSRSFGVKKLIRPLLTFSSGAGVSHGNCRVRVCSWGKKQGRRTKRYEDALRNCHQGRKSRILAEAKLLQTAASLRTRFVYVLIIILCLSPG